MCSPFAAPSLLLTEPVNVFIVTNGLDSGPGSLRQAILDANATPGAGGIDFDLSPMALILPLSQLPQITEAVVIDGTTRPEGFVELNGNNRVIDGLVLGGGNSVVRGLVTIQVGLNDIHVASRGNIVEGNLIGITANEFVATAPRRAGVRVSGVGGNTIGGTALPARNVISGKQHGVVISGATAAGNRILGNFIGTTVTGTAALPNTGFGIQVAGSAGGNTIGGAAAGATNTIAFNGGDGVFVSSGIGNQLRRNAIFANTGLGIDLAPTGVTPNDPGDGDTGANILQNFPVLTAVTSTATTTTITGSLNSVASSAFTLEFFRNLTCDGPTNGEGRVFLRDVAVTTNAGGSASFSVAVTPAVPAGQIVTATATRTATRDTSEFSACRAATAAAPSRKPGRGGGLPSINAE